MRRLLGRIFVAFLVVQAVSLGVWWKVHPHDPGPVLQTDEVLGSYLSADRDTWQQTDRVLKAMGLGPGDRIADIGAGSGYFAWHFSRVVGVHGRVVAVDVDPNAIDFMKRRLLRDTPGFPNIDFVLSRYNNVMLDADSVDHAFMCEAHFFVEPAPELITPCLASLFKAVRAGGKVSVIEVKDDPRRGHIPLTRLTKPFLKAGFVVDARHDFLGREYFVIFRKPGKPAPGEPAPGQDASPHAGS